MSSQPDLSAPAAELGVPAYRALVLKLEAAQASTPNARAQRGLEAIADDAVAQAKALSRVLTGADGWRASAEQLGGRFVPEAAAATGNGER